MVTKKKSFTDLATYIGEQVEKSNKNYGSSFEKAAEILKILYPEGIKPNQYNEISVITRILDKLSRIANGNKGKENAWNDIAGYGILMGDYTIKK